MQVEKLALMNSGRAGAMDVAAGLAMVKGSQIGKLILLSRAAEDSESMFKLFNVIRRIFGNESNAPGLAWVVVFEVVNPNKCSKCFGRGLVLESGAHFDCEHKVTCDKCNGSGVGWSSTRSMAKRAGYNETTFRRKKLDKLIKEWVITLEHEATDAAKKFRQQ